VLGQLRNNLQKLEAGCMDAPGHEAGQRMLTYPHGTDLDVFMHRQRCCADWPHGGQGPGWHLLHTNKHYAPSLPDFVYMTLLKKCAS
jgi:hypothetical protein